MAYGYMEMEEVRAKEEGARNSISKNYISIPYPIS